MNYARKMLTAMKNKRKRPNEPLAKPDAVVLEVDKNDMRKQQEDRAANQQNKKRNSIAGITVLFLQ